MSYLRGVTLSDLVSGYRIERDDVKAWLSFASKMAQDH
jgi:uncharacterized protein (DUF433 family)